MRDAPIAKSRLLRVVAIRQVCSLDPYSFVPVLLYVRGSEYEFLGNDFGLGADKRVAQTPDPEFRG
jgi:hypothetical protein